MSAFPPFRTAPSIPIDQETALKYLSSYLSAAQTTPHLLPNARLEPSGPTSGSSNSSITLHNLKRVEAGLRGEWLAPSLDMGESVKILKVMNDGVGQQEEVDGAMDLDEYQREQSVEGGEIGENETHVVRQEGDLGLELPKKKRSYEERDMELGSVEDEEFLTSKKVKKPQTPQDKAARKAAKKARKAAEKLTVKKSQPKEN